MSAEVDAPRTATFSIVGFDPATEELGVAVQSKFLAAGAIVPHIEAGVGAVATQAMANPAYGPEGLDLLAEGLEPGEVIERLTAEDDASAHRQVGVVDAAGRSATFTGEECMEWAGGITGVNYAAQGNILENRETVTAMARTFQESEGSLAERLLASLFAADEAGGDRRGKQSAALLVYKEDGGYGGLTDKYIDLRVDDSPRPIAKLEELLDLFQLYFVSQEDVEMVPLEGESLEEVQSLLSRFGYYEGEVDGEYDEEFEQALTDFYHQENFEERVPEERVIPADILDYLRQRVESRAQNSR